jgi:hypothetical protein
MSSEGDFLIVGKEAFHRPITLIWQRINEIVTGRKKCTYQVTKLSACWRALVTALAFDSLDENPSRNFSSPNTTNHPGIKQNPSRKDPPHEN